MTTLSRGDSDVLNQIGELHAPEVGGGMGYFTDPEGRWTYEHMESVCRSCGTPDEYAVAWPCATRKLLDMIEASVPV